MFLPGLYSGLAKVTRRPAVNAPYMTGTYSGKLGNNSPTLSFGFKFKPFDDKNDLAT